MFYIPAEDQIFKRVENMQRGDREMNIAMMRGQVKNYRRQTIEADSTIEAELNNFLITPEIISQRLSSPSKENVELTIKERHDGLSRASRKVQTSFQKITSNSNNRNYFVKQI